MTEDVLKKGTFVFNRKRGLLIVLIFSMAVLGVAVYWFAIESRWLSGNYQKQNKLFVQQGKFEDLYLYIQKAESGVRAYATSGDKKYVRNTGPVIDSIRVNYLELKNFLYTENVNISPQVIAEYDRLINAKILFMEKAKKLCDEDDCKGALELIATEKGIELTAAILALNERTNTSMRNSLLESKERYEKISNRNTIIAYICMAAAMLVISIIIYLLRKEISKTRHISQLLMIQKDYLRITLNSIGEGLIATGRDGKIVFMNPSAEQLTGWKNEEARSRPLQHVYNVINEETGQPFEGIVNRILKEGRAVAFENNTILKTKQENSLVISNSGAPLLDQDGKVKGAVLVFKDITQQKIIEGKIKSSEKMLRDMIQHLPEAVYTCDADGYIQHYNKAAVSLWGREPILGKERWSGSWEIYTTDGTGVSLENCPMAVAIKEARPVFGKEFLVKRKDGTYRHVLPSPTPLFNEDGHLTGAVNMLIDVTDKKEREVLISKTEEKYKNFIEQASDTIITYSLDGTIHEFNDTILSISGYSREEFSKLNLKDIIVGDLIINTDRVNEIMSGKVVTLSRQYKRKDGVILDIESKVKRLADGKILAFGRDVTERKRKEAELQYLKESYLTLINSVDGIVWEADPETLAFTFVSNKAERLLGYPRELWTRETNFWTNHMHEEDRDWAISYCKRCIAEMKAHDFEYRMVTRDGAIVWLRDMVSVQVENNKPVKLMGIMVDITGQKMNEQESMEKNKQLQLLAEHLQEIREEERASMAREIHDELGQQLTIMKMDISWLEENMPQENEAVGQRLTELKSMLDQTVTVVRRIAYELRPSLLDDMGLVAAIEWQLAEFEKRSGIRSVYKGISGRLPIKSTAKTGLFRIVQESLTNVGRYSNAKTVTVSLSNNDDIAILQIKDDGVGFEPGKLAFKKTLGIVGMKERCIMLGGEFNIESGPGKGTTITVTIPVQKGNEPE